MTANLFFYFEFAKLFMHNNDKNERNWFKNSTKPNC